MLAAVCEASEASEAREASATSLRLPTWWEDVTLVTCLESPAIHDPGRARGLASIAAHIQFDGVRSMSAAAMLSLASGCGYM